MDAKQLLDVTLRHAVEMDARELWFLSGVGVMAKTKKRSRTVHPEPLSAEAVRAIHEQCLKLADRGDLRMFSHARYTVTFSGIGTFSCEFVWRHNTGNLRLRREPEAFEMVEPTRGIRLPPLTAEATPNSPLRRTRHKTARR